MPTYIDSDLLLKSDNIEVIIDGEKLIREAVLDSTILLTSDNLEVIIDGERFVRTSVNGSDFILTSNNLEIIVKGTSLTPPVRTTLRQIYSDDTHVYGATNKGLVVFKL